MGLKKISPEKSQVANYMLHDFSDQSSGDSKLSWW